MKGKFHIKYKQICLFYLIKHDGVTAYTGMEVQFHVLLNLVLDGSKWPASYHDHFTSGEEPWVLTE